MPLEVLDHLLSRDGFIIYVSGAKEKGKTDFSLLLAEYSFLKGFRKHIATNIETESYMIEQQIVDLPTLKAWLHSGGRKLFILDEAGLSIPKLRFMSQMNIEIMKILQMIRHYDSGFIGIAPSTRNIDSTFMNTDILDAHIIKTSKTSLQVKDYLGNDTYELYHIPRTSINFNSKHIAEFTMQRKIIRSELPLCCQIAASYGQKVSIPQIAKAFNMHKEEARRLLQEHCRHTQDTGHKEHDGIETHKKIPEI